MEGYYVAVDIGGTFIKSALFNSTGEMKKRLESIPSPHSEESLKSAVSQAVRKAQQELVDEGVSSSNLGGIGVATTGIIDPQTQAYERSGSFPFMVGVNLADYLEEKFKMPCRMINDGQAALLGELWQGKLKNVSDGLLITVGTGLVSGHVFNGQAYFGAHGRAGELSSVTQNEYESYFPVKSSSAHFIEQAAQLLGLDDKQDGQAVFEHLEQGHDDLELMFESYCHQLSLLLFNLTVTLDPEMIVLSGGICWQQRFIDEVQRQYRHIYKNKSEAVLGPCQTQIEVSAVLSDANLIGALAQLLDSIEEEGGS